MPQHMYTVKLSRSGASLPAAAQKLGVELSALDSQFGLVQVNPAEDLYAVLLQEGATPAADGETTAGPFSNPAIGAFGPPRR